MSGKVERWRDWIDTTIKNDVITMHAHRYVWRDLQAVLANNPALPDSYWWIVLRDAYSRNQGVAVRRHADRRGDSAGLYRLILEIRKDSDRIISKGWLALWREQDHVDELLLQHAERGWSQHYAGTTGTHLDPKIPMADLKRLATECERVTHWVNTNVAHVKHTLTPDGALLADDAEPPSYATVTLGDIHDAIDVIGDLFRKYFNLLTASNMAQLDPILPPNWKGVFAQPWMTAADAAPFKPPRSHDDSRPS